MGAPTKERAARKGGKSTKINQQNVLCSRLGMTGLERFFSRSNVAFYRALANRRTSAAKRREILRLLEEEQTRFRLEFERDTAKKNQP